MNPRVMRVAWAGAGLVGKRTALFQTAQKAGTLATYQDTAGLVEFPWEVQDASIQIEGRALFFLSWMRFHNSAEAQQDPRAMEELLFLKRCDGLILVVDLQEGRHRDSHDWLERVWSYVPGFEPFRKPMVVCLNKADLVSEIEVQKAISALGLQDDSYVRTVAAKGKGLRKAVDMLLGKLV